MPLGTCRWNSSLQRYAIRQCFFTDGFGCAPEIFHGTYFFPALPFAFRKFTSGAKIPGRAIHAIFFPFGVGLYGVAGASAGRSATPTPPKNRQKQKRTLFLSLTEIAVKVASYWPSRYYLLLPGHFFGFRFPNLTIRFIYCHLKNML